MINMNEDATNKIILRPAYNSNELLIEFHLYEDEIEFIKKLEFELKQIEFKINSQMILIDQLLYKGNSILGDFELNIDNYDFAFIFSENGSLIKKIYEILKGTKYFNEVLVNFEDYK